MGFQKSLKLSNLPCLAWTSLVPPLVIITKPSLRRYMGLRVQGGLQVEVGCLESSWEPIALLLVLTPMQLSKPTHHVTCGHFSPQYPYEILGGFDVLAQVPSCKAIGTKCQQAYLVRFDFPWGKSVVLCTRIWNRLNIYMSIIYGIQDITTICYIKKGFSIQEQEISIKS